MFSPYYAWARARGAGLADPAQHVAVNVALYRSDGGPGARWAMTERGGAALQRSADRLAIGPSTLRWDGDALLLQLDERCSPLPRRLRGTVRLQPLAPGAPAPLDLDGAGLHQWWPIAPCARVEVDLAEPGWRWRGDGYLDSNRGAVPLAQGFSGWQWSRAALRGGHSAVVYDACALDGSRRQLAWRFDARGGAQPVAPPPSRPLPASAWGLARSQPSAGPAGLLQTLEDTPFYARTLVRADWLGEPVRAVHECLRLDRFARPWVQALLPFRMPRRG